MRGLFSAALAALALLSASSIEAQGELAVTLEFASPATCPDRSLFMHQVELRVGRPIRWQGGDVTIRVQVSPQAEEFSGHLWHARSGAASTERELTGQKCEDVVSGLALVAALALDPNASTVPSAELEAARPPPSAKPPAPAPTQPQTPEPPPAPPVAPPPVAPLPADAIDQRPAPLMLGVLAMVSADAGPAPDALIALGARFEAELRPSKLWRPSFALALQYARSGFLGAESSDARFDWLVVKGAFCPVAPDLFASVQLRACALADVGSMSAEGRSEAIANPERTDQLWLAAGLGPAIAYRPAWPWIIEVGGGALVTMTRPEYVFADPRTPVHSVPALAWTAYLGLGLSFFDQ